MILLDSGYLVALINTRDELHARAKAWLRVLRGPLIVTEYVLVEMMDTLSHPSLRIGAHGMYRLLTSSPEITVVAASSSLLRCGVELHHRRPDKDWSLTDCISFAVMEERRITQALAFDSHFQQAGYEPLLRRDP